MKKIVAFFITLLFLIGGVFPAAASDEAPAFQSVHPDFTEHTAEFKADSSFEKKGGDYYIDKTVVIKKDFTLPEKAALYIRKGGSLVIKNGADFTANGVLTVERGGSLVVKNGNFTETKVFYNFGEVDIRKDGRFVFCDDSKYMSNAGSRLVADGEVIFGELRLSDLVERISKYDKSFSLDSYCIRATDCGRDRTALCSYDITLRYCIGDIETDYYYKAKTDTATPKLTRKNYSLDRVYYKPRAEKLKKAAQKYADENDLCRRYEDPSCCSIDIGFSYSYRTRNLEAHAYCFQASYLKWSGDETDEAEFYYKDYAQTEAVGRV